MQPKLHVESAVVDILLKKFYQRRFRYGSYQNYGFLIILDTLLIIRKNKILAKKRISVVESHSPDQNMVNKLRNKVIRQKMTCLKIVKKKKALKYVNSRPGIRASSK